MSTSIKWDPAFFLLVCTSFSCFFFYSCFLLALPISVLFLISLFPFSTLFLFTFIFPFTCLCILSFSQCICLPTLLLLTPSLCFSSTTFSAFIACLAVLSTLVGFASQNSIHPLFALVFLDQYSFLFNSKINFYSPLSSF